MTEIAQVEKSGKNLFTLMLYLDQLITYRSIIALMLLFAPFTMGDMIPILSGQYYYIYSLLSILVIIMLYRKFLFHKRKLKNNYFIPGLFFASSLIVSIFIGPEYADITQFTIYDSTFGAVLKDVISFLVMQTLILFAVYMSIEKLEDIIYYFNTILYSGLLVNIVSLVLIWLFRSSGVAGDRLGATFSDPNYLARFEVFIIVISLCYFLFSKKSFGSRIVLILNIPICMLILYLTFSRSAILTLALVVPFIIMKLKNKYLKISIITSVVIFLFSLFTIVGQTRNSDAVLGSQSKTPSTVIDYSNTTRLALNYAAFDIFLDYPLFGVGFHNFYNVYINYDYIPFDIPLAVTVSVVHSWLFSIIAEQGLFGLISLLWIIVLMTKGLWRESKGKVDNNQKMIAVILFCLFFVLLFDGLFFPVFFTEVMFTILLGLIGGYFRVVENDARQDSLVKFNQE